MSVVAKKRRSSGWVDRLWYAVEYNDVRTVQSLIEGGADVNHPFGPIRTEQGKRRKQAPIFIAVRKNYQMLTEVLVDAHCNLDQIDDRGETPLFVAVQRANLGLVKILVAAGCNLERRNVHGETVVHVAVSGGCTKILLYLISIGCDIDTCDNKQESPLMLAADLHAIAMERNIQTRRGATHSQQEIILCLAENSLNISAINMFRETALHIAVRLNGSCCGQFNIPLMLMQHGADCNIQNEVGETPLSLACSIFVRPIYFSMDIVMLMLAAGAELSLEPLIYQDLQDTPPSIQDDFNYLRKLVYCARSLQDLCRIFLRKRLNAQLWKKIDQLPIPVTMKSYLKLQNYEIRDVIRLEMT
jgi:ankyrin repeat protein